MTPLPRHAIVTGASRGIGAAIGHALAAEGVRITALARDADALAARWGDQPNARWAVCDVTDRDEVIRQAEAAAAAFGPADILVNNAGAEASAPFLKTGADVFRRLFEVNVMSAVHCSQAVLPQMRAMTSARIVNVASVAGLRGYGYVSAYVASKHALVGLTRALAAELASTGVTTNAVCPSFTDTDMVTRAVDNIAAKTGLAPQAALEELARGNPQKRLIAPEEVAAAVAWLCSPAAQGVNGHCVAIDGGQTA